MSADDRREVIRLINEWNSSRYELFALSQPNERLEFHGVMRFYFQDAGEKVSTKCIRVDSTASTEDVIKVLIEKFRPDMKSLSSPKDYAIYEVHADSQERKLGANEHPLWIQLDWGKDGREGRFLLKNENAKTVQFDTTGDGLSLLRDKKRMSKREKKKLLQQQQQTLKNSNGSAKDSSKENKQGVAEHLYKEVPDSNFTRSISNPEIVMARRRQQKLENKLKQIKNRDGGGTLKVYGETLKPDIPYKTLLMSNQDTAAFAVKETLEKYGLPNEEPDNYCLVQVVTPSKEEREKQNAQIKEYILEDNACPLAILIKHPSTSGSIIFQIRRCTPDILALRKQKKKAELEKQQQLQQQHQNQQKIQTMQSQPNLQNQNQNQMNNNNNKNAQFQQRPVNTMLSNQATQSMHHFNSKQQQQQQQHYQPQQFKQQQDSIDTASSSNINHFNNNNNQHQQMNSNNHTNDLINSNNNNNNNNSFKLPYLVELNHEGYELQTPRIIQIKSDFYEIGNDKYLASTHPANYIRLDSSLPGIEKKHCALKKSMDNLQLLLVPFAETYVNDRLIKEPTQLFNLFTIRLGKFALFRLENPNELNNLVIANNNNLNSNTNKLTSNKPTNNNNINNGNGVVIPANYGTLYDSNVNGNSFEVASPQTTVTTAIASNGPSSIQLMSSTNINQNTNPSQQQPQSSGQITPNGGIPKPAEGLPGLLEFPDDGEDSLLAQICTTNHANWQFKLAPVYTMYMMLRYRLSQKYKSEQMSFSEKLNASSLLIHKMVNYIREAVDTHHLDKLVLPYWLANSSELLYFLKQDVHLSQISYEAQDILADCVQITFKYLVNIMQLQLDLVLVSFFDPSDHIEEINITDLNENNNIEPTISMLQTMENVRPTLKHVIQVLNEAMNLLRGSRVNAALTIQLFSQLFHYISMWLFNKLIRDERRSGLCSRYWGDKLTRRLTKIQVWAEKQGLELAADCHLSRIIQAAFFLHTPKSDIKDLSTISSNCFALNSLQIRCLLSNYLLAPPNQEQPLSQQLCANLISIAQNTADEVLKQEGRSLQLEEEVDLQLPFLLPEDGHSCEFIKGLPVGLLDFLEQLQNQGHCWLWQNTQGPGSWKKFMIKPAANGLVAPASDPQTPQTPQLQPQTPTAISPFKQHLPTSTTNTQQQLPQTVQQQQQPIVIKIKLNKKNNGLGLSIVAARGQNQINSGIYVKSVVMGGAASDDGRITAGDQLLAVDDASLINVTQERAAELMTKSGQSVLLTVAKEAATFHNLDALLSKSPLPQQQQSIGASMPQLPLSSSNINQINPVNTTTTLPRNHHMNIIQQNQLDQTDQIPQSNNLNSYRARSMSQEILQQQQRGPIASTAASINNLLTSGSNSINNGGSPIKSVLKQQQQITQPSSTASSFSNSSTQPNTLNNHFNHNNNNNNTHLIRGLPNEHQIRYSSERPVSMLASSANGANNNMNNNHFAYNHKNTALNQQQFLTQHQRTLPNEILPRFGSERPAASTSSLISSSNHYNLQQQQQQQHQQQITSPLKQQIKSLSNNINTVVQPIQQHQRQASLSEIDEINYANRQSLIEQQQSNQLNNNKFEDLYGKVNPNRLVNGNKHSPVQQYKTLPSQQQQQQQQQLQHRNEISNIASQQNQQASYTNGHLIQDNNINQQHKAKPFGQLYEQIWANNQQQQQQQNNHNSVDDLNLNLNKIDINSTNSINSSNSSNTNRAPTSNLNNLTNQQSSVRVIPINKFATKSNSDEQINQQQIRNYENQIINQQAATVLQQQQQQNKPPIIANKPQMHYRLNNNNENDDETFRIQLLNQRMELLAELESKSTRTNEEENKLNKLRTEIEFDKRVLEMNNHMLNGQTKNFMDETNEEEEEGEYEYEQYDQYDNNDMIEYSPEVKARLADQMRDEMMQRRKLFENISATQTTSNINNNQYTKQKQQQQQQQQQQQHLSNVQINGNGISSILNEELKYREFQQQASSTRFEIDEMKKRQSEEHDRLMEMRREEMRLRKHIDLKQTNNSQQLKHHQFSNSTGNLLGSTNQQSIESEIEIVPIQHSNNSNQQHQRQLPKHVQFTMNGVGVISGGGGGGVVVTNTNTDLKANNNKPISLTSSSSINNAISSDELNSNSNSNSSQSSSSPPPPPPPPPVQPPPPVPPKENVKRVMFNDTAKYLNFEPDNHHHNYNNTNNNNNNHHHHSTPSVIGANEIYVDKRLKIKQQLQQEQQMANMFLEGEKLSFKDKMKLFAKQSGGDVVVSADANSENKFKVSKKQREIESKFEMK